MKESTTMRHTVMSQLGDTAFRNTPTMVPSRSMWGNVSSDDERGAVVEGKANMGCSMHTAS